MEAPETDGNNSRTERDETDRFLVFISELSQKEVITKNCGGTQTQDREQCYTFIFHVVIVTGLSAQG